MNHPESTAAHQTEADAPIRSTNDRLIGITDIRRIFKLGRTAAYELTHRPGFPDRVEISLRCHRWWASEVNSFADTLRRTRSQGNKRRLQEPRMPGQAPALKITGTVRPIRDHKQKS